MLQTQLPWPRVLGLLTWDLQEDECRLKASIEKHPGQRRLTREKMWPKTNDTTLIEFIQVADRHTLLSITGFHSPSGPL